MTNLAIEERLGVANVSVAPIVPDGSGFCRVSWDRLALSENLTARGSLDRFG